LASRREGVFINVPFDRRYKKLFDALVFAVHDCGLLARGAREEDDSSQVRFEKRSILLAIVALAFMTCRASRWTAKTDCRDSTCRWN